ncbi:unnamed protein product [Cuscuta epithymum]|uniref:Uncharacterized protein n=1 Tax=Cuscuta epithymum TaxID=186058 RepID=A0AAV0FIM8_9ASTE|nr:unnamed protein product [Cuscuta epithymum]
MLDFETLAVGDDIAAAVAMDPRSFSQQRNPSFIGREAYLGRCWIRRRRRNGTETVVTGMEESHLWMELMAWIVGIDQGDLGLLFQLGGILVNWVMCSLIVVQIEDRSYCCPLLIF